MLAHERLPDRDSVVEVADIPQEIGAIGPHPRRDDRSIVRMRVILDYVDDRHAQARGKGLLPAAD